MGILQTNKPGTKLQGLLSMSFWRKGLLLLYIFTMPFVSAFAFTGTISLPLIFAVFLFLLMGMEFIRYGKFPKGFVGYDLLIIFLFLFLVLFTFLINGWGNQKSLNHTIAYLSTFLLFYVTIKYTLFTIENEKRVLKRVLQIITWVTIISAVYANLEFIFSNIFEINLNDYVPRPSEEEKFYDASVIGLFYRARGFAPESGHFAFMMELFSPLTLFYIYFSGYCKWSVLLKGLIIIVIFFSFIFATSSASFIIVPVTVLFALLVHFKKVLFYIKKQMGKFLLVTTIVSVIILLLNYFYSFYALLLLSLTDKADSVSFDDRQERINFFYDKLFHLDPINKLCGVGPAGFSILGFDETKSILSLYYSLVFELGFLGLLLVSLLFFYLILQALKINSKIGFFLLISVTSGVIHYYFIANFWYPWFWFIAAFTIFCRKKFSNE